LPADAFAQTLRAALPVRRRTLSAAEVAAIRAEHAATIARVTARLAEPSRLENELSRLVNQAYGLTPEDERLMWATAPPRMPITPPADPGEIGPPRAPPDTINSLPNRTGDE
jgi:hypothetical protein